MKHKQQINHINKDNVKYRGRYEKCLKILSNVNEILIAEEAEEEEGEEFHDAKDNVRKMKEEEEECCYNLLQNRILNLLQRKKKIKDQLIVNNMHLYDLKQQLYLYLVLMRSIISSENQNESVEEMVNVIIENLNLLMKNQENLDKIYNDIDHKEKSLNAMIENLKSKFQ